MVGRKTRGKKSGERNGERNQEGERILEFCQSRVLKVLNTMFKKGREKKINYKSGGAETQIDYLLLRKDREIRVKDCKVIPGEACLPQHRLLTGDLITMYLRRKESKEDKKIKEWKLKDEETRTQFEVRFQQKNNINREGWKQLSDNVLDAAKEVCSETTGHGRKRRETWWWNETVQRAVKEKKTAYERQRKRNEEDKREYKEAG